MKKKYHLLLFMGAKRRRWPKIAPKYDRKIKGPAVCFSQTTSSHCRECDIFYLKNHGLRMQESVKSQNRVGPLHYRKTERAVSFTAP